MTRETAPRLFASVDDAASLISVMRASGPHDHRLLVGLAGAPGSGKSTVATELAERLEATVVLPMDGFHLPQARLVELGRRERMGAPDTFDVDAFVALLESLRDVNNSGRTVLAPAFDRTIEEPVADGITLSPEVLTVIVEGNYLLLDSGGWERVAPLLDLTLGVELDEATRHERLTARHIAYGKTPDAARTWTLGPDEENARLVTASLSRADALLRR